MWVSIRVGRNIFRSYFIFFIGMVSNNIIYGSESELCKYILLKFLLNIFLDLFLVLIFCE